MRELIIRRAKWLWEYLDSLMLALIGLVMALTWAVFPAPHRDALIEVNGTLSGWVIYRDQSFIGRIINRHAALLFSVEGVTGRFWNPAVGPGTAVRIFERTGVPVQFWRERSYRSHRIDGSGEKTYGLTVDGNVIESLDNCLAAEQAGTRYLMPPVGLALLGLAAYRWRRQRRLAQSSPSV